MEPLADDSASPLKSLLRRSAMRADRLTDAVRRILEAALREVDLLLLDALREGFGYLPLPLPRPLCIS